MIDDSETKTIIIIFSIFCALSIFSQLLILFFYIKYLNILHPKLFSSRLVISMAFTDILVWTISFQSNIVKLSTGESMFLHNKKLCIFEGIIYNSFILMNIVFTVVFSFSMMMEIKFDYLPLKHEKKIYFATVFYSFFFSLLPIFLNGKAYGENDKFKCWISDHDLRFAGFYSHLWLCFLINLGIVIYILWLFKDFHYSQNYSIKKLILIPFIMLVCWTEPSIRRIISNDQIFWLQVLHYISIPLQGVLNSIVYGLINDTVKKKIKKIFNKNKMEETETGINFF